MAIYLIWSLLQIEGDCLSLLWTCERLKHFFCNRSKLVDIFEDNFDSLEIDFENLSPSDCSDISFLKIDEIEEATENYKPYLENYFSGLGNKKKKFFY